MNPRTMRATILVAAKARSIKRDQTGSLGVYCSIG